MIEETGSWGAKAFSKTGFTAPLLVVGEPTDNCMVSASKGTKRFNLTFSGRPFHSGYPEHGLSAVELFVDFMERLRAAGFPEDPALGATTWNVGQLHSDNPQNILSPELTCRIYFRTTFASDAEVVEWMRAQAGDTLRVEEFGGDAPARYLTLPGFPSKSVAFGSDAPHLTNFAQKIICGPGSITVAHRDDEFLSFAELGQATEHRILPDMIEGVLQRRGIELVCASEDICAIPKEIAQECVCRSSLCRYSSSEAVRWPTPPGCRGCSTSCWPRRRRTA